MELMRSAAPPRVIVLALAAFIFGIAAAADAGSLSGHVKDQFGGPIANAVVEILDPDTFDTVASDVSDATGAYSISIADGTYALFVSPPPSSEIPPLFLENIAI